MNQKFNAEPIRQMLNRSASQLDQPTLAKLRDVREQALARHDARSSAPAYAWVGALTGAGRTTKSHHSHYYWAAIVLLAASLFSSIDYVQHALEHDNSEVDIAILTDEMPVDVYVD